MTTFFTSDTHYGHKNIIKFSERPFADLTDMREELIRRWNDIVGPEDDVYHLGDFSFTDVKEGIQIVRRLNGRKHLIWGNHDHRHYRGKAEFVAEWVWCKDLAEIEVQGTKIVMSHYPLLTWNKSHHGSYHVHGHCHGSLKPDPGALRVDVGVDCWDYYPVTFEEIAKVMATKTFVPVDHHGTRGDGA